MTDDLTTLAADLARVQEAQSALADREKDLKARILALTDGPDRYAAGALTVQVTQARNLDKAALTAKYPADQFPELYEETISTARVRAAFAPNDLEPFEKLWAPSVRLT